MESTVSQGYQALVKCHTVPPPPLGNYYHPISDPRLALLSVFMTEDA